VFTLLHCAGHDLVKDMLLLWCCSLEVRAFMAAQNLQMGDAGAAVLRGFLHRADEAGDAAKNKIILALNNIMVRFFLDCGCFCSE